MMNKKVNIIGAGLTGLSAGIYLGLEGVETEIFELAPWAGGMCSVWVRKGYRFDGCICWMEGTKSGTPVNQLYKEVGALTDETAIYYAGSVQFEIEGALYEVPMELQKFKSFMLSLSPNDSALIEESCRNIEVMMEAKMIQSDASGVTGVTDHFRNSLCLRAMTRKYSALTVNEYVENYASPLLGKIIKRLLPGEYSAFSYFATLGSRMANNAGYPLGGAAGVVGRMVEKYRSLGGKINFESKVDEIVIVGGEAKGIRSRGELHPADGIVAACDAYDALEHMLKSRYNHPQLSRLLKSAPLFEPLAVVSFGLGQKFNIPYALTCECPEGFNVAPGVRRYGYALRSFDFDPTAAPPGGSSVVAMFEAPLDYWKKLRHDNPESYKIQKELLADLIASKIEQRYPGFRDAVCIVDVATPATFDRLTNVYRGSFEGFAPTPSSLRTRIDKTLPGLGHFCICGQWTTAGGGIGAAVADGKTAAKIMKKEIK